MDNIAEINRAEIISALDDKRVIYYIDEKSGAILVGGKGMIDLTYIKSVEGVDITFTNDGSVDLQSIKDIHTGIKFKNKGAVFLDSLSSIPQDFIFENGEGVMIISMGVGGFSKGVRFKNRESNCWIDLKNREIFTTLPRSIPETTIMNYMIKQLYG